LIFYPSYSTLLILSTAGEDHSKLARVNWGKLGENDTASDRDTYPDEDDIRYTGWSGRKPQAHYDPLT